MNVYRISSCEFINDLSGKGAALYGGRWNSKNIPMLYTAESRSLAMLETVVHLGNICSIRLCTATILLPSVPMDICKIEDLPKNWDNAVSTNDLKIIGDYFIRTNKKLALIVPSAIMPDEHNILINPQHPDFQKVRIVETKPINIDERLLKA